MKKIKKFMALVIAVIMCIVMAVPTMAAGEGSIKIDSSEEGTTYNFYRILNLTGTDTDSPANGTYDAVSYTIATKWEGFFKGTAAGVSYLIAAGDATEVQKESLNQINFNGTVYYLNLTNGNVVAFTNSAMTYALDNSIDTDYTENGTGSDVTKNSMDLGYYLMVPVDASIKTANSSGSVASLTSTIPNATIQVKAEKPSITKIDDKVSADVGQAVTYTITGKVPNTAGYSTYKYIIKDEMTSGLTFNKDVVVKLDGVDITNNVTFDYSTTNEFSADIPVASLQGENGANIGKDITLTYTATVNDAAVASDNEKNKATLQYGHKTDNLKVTTPIEEEVYTAKIVINKYTGDSSTGTKLANAQFALMNKEGKYYKYTAAVEDQPAKVEWVTITGAPTSGTVAVTDAQAKALADATSNFTPKTTNENGAAEFLGIADGTYYLVEFAAPNGYNRLDKPQVVTVAGENADTTENGKKENIADATGKYDVAKNSTADVENNSGSVLPSTGGIGTTIFYIVGAILVIGAGVLLVTRRRMGANKYL